MTAAHIAAAMAADHAAINNPGAVSVPGVRQRAGASAPVCTTLTIPAPPSVNKLFKTLPGNRRAKTRDYTNWLNECGWLVREQLTAEGCDPVPGRVVVLISVERTNMLADCDNLTKATLDLLVKMKVIDDDRFVTATAITWAPMGNRQRPKARIAIMPAVAHRLNFHPHTDGATGGWFIDAPEGEDCGDYA